MGDYYSRAFRAPFTGHRMSFSHVLVRSLVAGALCAPLAGCGRAPTRATAIISDVAVIDVERGTLAEHRDVLIDGTRIVAVETAGTARVPDDTRRIDGRGRFLIPGLWDMHAHIMEQETTVAGPLFIANGVTGVREMWSDGAEWRGMLLALRDSVRRGVVIGPRLLLSATPMDGPPGSEEGVTLIHSADEARAAVDTAAAHGVDIAQSFQWLGRDAYMAAAARAQERSLSFGGLVPLSASFDDAIQAKHRTRDYFGEWWAWCAKDAERWHAQLDAAARKDAVTRPRESSVSRLYVALQDQEAGAQDDAGCRALARRLAADSVWQVPRLVTEQLHADARPHDPTRDSLRARFVGPAAAAFWSSIRGDRQATARDPVKLARQRARWERTRALMRLLHESGVRLLAGTETGDLDVVPGFALHDELALLVDIGMSPTEALRAATLEPARSLGASDSLGTVAPGMLADLVLLDRNPLSDIGATRDIHAVIANGKIHDRAGLTALLARAAAAAMSAREATPAGAR